MMKSLTCTRCMVAWQPLALAAMVTLAFPAIAQTSLDQKQVSSDFPALGPTVPDQKLAPVTVSASRFQNNPSFAPIGATVITAAQIRDAGIGNVNEAIRKIGGVYGRQNLNGTSDYSLDLRGFGETSNQNIVVMVDGIRISETEQANALMSSISIESVERIEIVRGGSTVMYGEGATAGTIQIITKRGLVGATRGSIFAEVGNHNSKEVRASLAKGWDGFSIDANISGLNTDNYRDNNKLRQDNFSGGMQWASPTGRVGVRIDASNQDSGLPGGLSWEQFLQNPRQAKTPLDYGSIDTNRYTLFGEQIFGNWEIAADLSHRDKSSDSFYAPSVGENTADGRATQFSPRIRHVLQSGTTRNELVVGLDFSDSSRRVIYAGSTDALTTSQQSNSIYIRDEIQLDKFRVAAGARHEKFDQDFNSSFSSYDQAFSLNAWDLQGRYDFTSMLSVFAKAGRSYRVANVDDNGFTLNNTLLNPQTSDDLEVGASYGNQNGKVTAKLFQQKIKNEIFYDPTVPNCGGFCTGANVNLDPTKHEGIEIEGNIPLTQTFALSAILQHIDATFIGGPYAGREMTLIPKNTATLRLNWLPGNGQTADVGVQWADTQRYGGDVTNTCSALIPSFATLDAHYAIRVGAWEFGVTGANLTDKSYFSQAFGACQNSASIYPDAGRSVKVSARMDF